MNYSRFTHPGVILKDNIYSLGLTPLTFSRIANLPVWTVEGIINGTKDITPTIADALERGTAVPASFWMVRQRNYDACKPRDVVPNERNS